MLAALCPSDRRQRTGRLAQPSRTRFQPVSPYGEEHFLELPNAIRAQIHAAIAEQYCRDLGTVRAIAQWLFHFEKRMRAAGINFGGRKRSMLRFWRVGCWRGFPGSVAATLGDFVGDELPQFFAIGNQGEVWGVPGTVMTAPPFLPGP